MSKAMEQAFACATVVLHEPVNHSDAMRSPDAQEWKKAEQEELQALSSASTWVKVDRPKGCSVVSYKWVYKIKQSSEGKIERYKARLVVRGFSQRPRYDYDKTFLLVIRYEYLSLLLACSANKG